MIKSKNNNVADKFLNEVRSLATEMIAATAFDQEFEKYPNDSTL